MSSKDPRYVFLESAIAEYEDYLSSLPERGKKHQDELADLEKRRDKRLAELRVKIVAGRPNNGTASQLQRSELFAAQMEAIQREQERIRIRKRLVDETIEQQMRSGGDLEPAQVEPTRPEGEMPPRASGRLIEDEVDPDRSPERAAL
jgi:hypothetical protein